jgi:DNA-binding CsgD family transcriptional regulator
VRRLTSEKPLAVYVLPVTAAADPMLAQFLTRSRAMVLVVDSAPNAPADPTIVRDLLGLTLGEARVAALVGAGSPPRNAAKTLGISEETARTVLKRVFQKVGVSRQGDLAALLTKLVLR